jgi:outer membrane lipoprotein-sorting protein
MNSMLMSKVLIILLTGLVFVMNPVRTIAEEANNKSDAALIGILNSIKEKEKTIKTFSAQFVQVKKSKLLKEPLYSKGVMYFDAAGKFLWKVIEPSPVTILLENNTVLIHYPDLSKTVERRVNNVDNILGRYIGIGQSLEELNKRYAIKLLPSSDETHYHLSLKPKDSTIPRYISLIEVEVNSQELIPDKIRLKEPEGDYTLIQLKYTSINQPLSPGIFTIKPRQE